jgi:DNA-binding LytR/AlgR family response regulator
MKICICSKDSDTLQAIGRLLIPCSYSVHIEFETTKVDTLDSISCEAFPFDILFIDAIFNEKLDGLAKAMALRKAGVDSFIVIMAEDDVQIAHEAYVSEISYYLIKPFTKSHIEHIWDNITARLTKANDRHNRMLILCLDGLQVVHKTNIVYIVAKPENRHRILSLTDGNRETTETLVELYAKLPDNRFVYAHRSYIVNLEHVDRYDSESITMTGGTQIPLSRIYRDDFMQAIQSCFG